MIRVSVVSSKELTKSVSKIIVCVIVFVLLISALKYSNAHFSQTELSTNKYISCLTDEITVMGSTDFVEIPKINPESILDSELKFFEYTKTGNMQSVGTTTEDDDTSAGNNSENQDNTQKNEVSNKENNNRENSDKGNDNKGNNNSENDDKGNGNNKNDNKENADDENNGSTENNSKSSNNNEEINQNGENQIISWGTAQSPDIVVGEVQQGVKTEVVKSTYKPTYNFQLNGVKIKNETSFNLATMNLSPSNVNIENKNVIIFHTHTCESYTQTEGRKYTPSGNFRTTDLNYSVARVGDVLQSYLTSYGFNVTHDKTYHDYPTYNGSYGRSLKTVSNILSKTEKTDIIIDLHRDAMNDESYAPKVKIGDEYVAQIMFVIGTNGSGLSHSNWKSNLEFAIKVQQKADEMYPGLFKPIIVRDARYNQHLSSAATIIEFGATGNTLEECEGAAKYLAKVLENF